MRFGLLNEMSGFVWRPVNNPNDEGVDPSRTERTASRSSQEAFE